LPSHVLTNWCACNDPLKQKEKMNNSSEKPKREIPRKNGKKVQPTGKRIGKSRPNKANNQLNRRVK
jgi:hypothetical protein